jgi:hypothetical protein
MELLGGIDFALKTLFLILWEHDDAVDTQYGNTIAKGEAYLDFRHNRIAASAKALGAR